ncbi:hypothetical protein AGMMS49959_12190 [Planctomycetales bacterium]|nr:hypothetical protein AGMMS49959_12190 [Planctomycetales bacterium]
MTSCRCLLLAALTAVLIACAEKPEIDEETFIRAPKLVGAYSLLEDAALPPMLYLRSDYPSVAGMRVGGRVERYGRRSLAHAIDLTAWTQSAAAQNNAEITLLVDDQDREKFYYRLPAAGDAATIGFLHGGRDRAPQLAAAAEEFNRYQPNAVVVLGNATPLDGQLRSWDQFFFKPFLPLSRRVPLVFLPEDRAKMPPLAANPLPRRYWARDLGCVRLYFGDLELLKNPTTRQEWLTWLARDLSMTTQPWKILCLSQPVFGMQEINAWLVETFGALLEHSRVNLVISGGVGYYLRTVPVQSGDFATRYLNVGGLDTEKQKLLGREYAAVVVDQPQIGILRATPASLTWTIYPLVEANKNPTPLDTLTITADGESGGEPAVEKTDILTDALAALTLRREVLTLARQAAKAVPDLTANKQTLNFILHNPTGQPLRGVLQWQAASDTAWKIQPEAVEFQLQPGFRGTTTFTAERYITVETAPMPELTATIENVGSATQPLIFAAKKSAEIAPRAASSSIMIDGVASEPDWEQATVLRDFITLGGGAPNRPFAVKMLTDAAGIYLFAQAATGGSPATAAKFHDDAVHRDDSVEFFFDPTGEGRDFYQFAVNSAGVTLDRSSQFGLAWNPQWQVKTHPQDDGYAVEAFIPFAAFGLTQAPAARARWGFDVFHNDFTGGADLPPPIENIDAAITPENIASAARRDLGARVVRETGKPVNEIVQWADTFGSNARSGCYGEIIFGGR